MVQRIRVGLTTARGYKGHVGVIDNLIQLADDVLSEFSDAVDTVLPTKTTGRPTARPARTSSAAAVTPAPTAGPVRRALGAPPDATLRGFSVVPPARAGGEWVVTNGVNRFVCSTPQDAERVMTAIASTVPPAR